MSTPSLEVRLKVLAAVDYAQGSSIRARIKSVSEQSFTDTQTGQVWRFTWRTISTWLYRYKKHGIATLEKKHRSDKHHQRKVNINELAEAIHEVLPTLTKNKVGQLPKSTVYRCLLQRNYFTRRQLAPTTFYRFVREHELLTEQSNQKLRMAFAMLHANELCKGECRPEFARARSEFRRERSASGRPSRQPSPWMA